MPLVLYMSFYLWALFQISVLIISDCNSKKLLQSVNGKQKFRKAKVVQFFWDTV